MSDDWLGLVTRLVMAGSIAPWSPSPSPWSSAPAVVVTRQVVVGHPSSYWAGSGLLNFCCSSCIRTPITAQLDSGGKFITKSYKQLHINTMNANFNKCSSSHEEMHK